MKLLFVHGINVRGDAWPRKFIGTITAEELQQARTAMRCTRAYIIKPRFAMGTKPKSLDAAIAVQIQLN